MCAKISKRTSFLHRKKKINNISELIIYYKQDELTYLWLSFSYLIVPGGRVVGVSVLLTATVSLFTPELVNTLLTSHSNGRWPPLWLITSTELTHWKQFVSNIYIQYKTPSDWNMYTTWATSICYLFDVRTTCITKTAGVTSRCVLQSLLHYFVAV